MARPFCFSGRYAENKISRQSTRLHLRTMPKRCSPSSRIDGKPIEARLAPSTMFLFGEGLRGRRRTVAHNHVMCKACSQMADPLKCCTGWEVVSKYNLKVGSKRSQRWASLRTFEAEGQKIHATISPRPYCGLFSSGHGALTMIQGEMVEERVTL